ncbi:MAG: hypothetical protein KGL39_50625 [Patescibacteria group bacterium]|nr:hypothetical protein [Patescibacteria group bacterium]
MILAEGSFWGVAKAKGQQAAFAAGQLRERGKQCYLPKTYERIKVGKRFVAHTTMRFSPYFFVECRHDAGWISDILRTRGVADLLRQPEGKALRVAKRIIDGFMAAEDAEYEAMTQRVRRKQSSYRPGIEVVIEHHPLWEGRTGKLLEDRDGTAQVLMSEFIWVTLPTMDIRPVDGGKSEEAA